MRRTNRITQAAVTLLLATSLLLPAPFLETGATAQRPQTSPIPVTNTTPVGEPERVDLGGGKYKLVYRNGIGQIIRENEHDGDKVQVKEVESVYPGGQVAKATIKHFYPVDSVPYQEYVLSQEEEVRYDSSGARQEREVRVVDGDYRRQRWNPDAERWEAAPEKQKWNPYTGRWEQVAPNERFDPKRGIWEKLNPDTGRWEDIPEPESPEDILDEIDPVIVPASAAPSGQLKSSAKPGHAVAAEVVAGLNTTLFSTPRGKIRVHLPDDMAAGDTISGTVSIQPEGKDQNEQARNQGELSGYVVEMEKQQTSSSGGILKLAVPTAISTTHVILRDKTGEEIARREISVTRQPPPVEEFDLPTLGQQGRPIEVRGPFDGDFSTTNCKVGGEDLKMLAESPRKIVARNTSGQLGPSDLEVKERDQTARGEFRTLGLKLSAPKVNLRKGEQTTLVVVVSGLEGIKDIVPLDLENKSSSVIQMAGGEVQRINISPSQVQGGTYTTERPLTGVQPGAFTIVGTVISGRQRPDGISTAANTPESLGAVSSVPQTSKPGNLPPNFTLCGAGCAPVAKGSGDVWCTNQTNCTTKGAPCSCNLFKRPNKDKDWDHDAKPGTKRRDDGSLYHCFCVK